MPTTSGSSSAQALKDQEVHLMILLALEKVEQKMRLPRSNLERLLGSSQDTISLMADRHPSFKFPSRTLKAER